MSQLRTPPRSTSPRNRFQPRQIRPGGSTATGGVVDYRLDLIAEYGPIGGRWLDCGSCEGEYTVALASRGAELAVGAEPDESRTTAARHRWRDHTKVQFVTAAGEALPFPDCHFDGVLLNEVLEHVDDQEATLRELRRVLAPGGVLALFSPNRWFPFEGHGMSIGSWNISSPVPLLPWLPRRLSLPVMKARNYWPYELRDLVACAGLTIMDVNYALPLLSHYPWLPRAAISRYQALVPRLHQSRSLRRFGVSTLIVAHRPDLRSPVPPGADPAQRSIMLGR